MVESFQPSSNKTSLGGELIGDLLSRRLWADECGADFQDHKAKRTAEFVGSLAAGAAIYLVARKAPQLANDLVGLRRVAVVATVGTLAVESSFHGLNQWSDFVHDASNVNDPSLREQITRRHAQLIAHRLAPFVDTTLMIVAGAGAGLLSADGALSTERGNAWGDRFMEKYDYPRRRRPDSHLLSEFGRGSFTPTVDLVNEDQVGGKTFNVWAAQQEIDSAQQHPGSQGWLTRWISNRDPGERGRLIDFEKRRSGKGDPAPRIGREYRGTQTSIVIPSHTEAVIWHTHERAPRLSGSPLASVGDWEPAVPLPKRQVVGPVLLEPKSPDAGPLLPQRHAMPQLISGRLGPEKYMSLFVPTGSDEARTGVQLVVNKNPQARSAFRMELSAIPVSLGKQDFRGTDPIPVDYHSAVEMLKRVDPLHADRQILALPEGPRPEPAELNRQYLIANRQTPASRAAARRELLSQFDLPTT